MAVSTRCAYRRYFNALLLALSLMVVQKLQPLLEGWVDFAIIQPLGPIESSPAAETRADCPWRLLPPVKAALQVARQLPTVEPT